MTRPVFVTRAQRAAARLILARAAAAGRPVRPAIRKIAEAQPARRKPAQ